MTLAAYPGYLVWVWLVQTLCFSDVASVPPFSYFLPRAAVLYSKEWIERESKKIAIKRRVAQ